MLISENRGGRLATAAGLGKVSQASRRDPDGTAQREAPSTASLRRFETLWIDYRRDLQLGKLAAAAILDEVRKGRLPCDADLLRNRARALIQLDPLLPHLRLRQLLSDAPRAILAHEPQVLLQRAAHLAALLPGHDTTHVLMTVLPHMDRDVSVTAANYLELDGVFGAAFGGARLPPSAFAHLLRAPAASVLPPASADHAVGLLGAATGQLEILKAEAQPALEEQIQAGQEGAVARDDMPARQQLLPAGATATRLQVAQARAQSRVQASRGFVDSAALFRRMQALVLLFGREVAYVAVQRRPQLMDRDPHDLAARLLQILAAVEAHSPAPPSTRLPQAAADVSPAVLTSTLGVAAGSTTAVLAAAVATRGRAASRVLEEAPQVLDLELADVRQRVAELSTSLEWGGAQVSQLVQQVPAVLLRPPEACRENLARLRLYSLKRPTTWFPELGANLAAGRPPPSTSVQAAGSIVNSTATFALPGGGGAQDLAAGLLQELEPEVLALVGRMLCAEDEVLDRLEYCVVSDERAGASLRELLWESRMKFVKQCPRYSRWWAEALARQRSEDGDVFGFGSGVGLGVDEGREEEDDDLRQGRVQAGGLDALLEWTY
ncbi:hypothetical protein HYH02_005275 [Chlamydomonas schloesseri]|uniref:Uncharacterized protein n=1 Tax=Chlamydomonas schloesseri TaxID=2026947 RepID=A0A836B7G0_9CHLO|nr:hypothetical protein HYH02_005275 [Chlamydomonas schloesseri]|eukprot:KAG2449750.1 hypothetical protein HYH02_005275 [Chlamydomonas schloesseri]